MTTHKQKCSNCGHTNVTKLISQNGQGSSSGTFESTQVLQPGESFGFLKTIFGFRRLHLPDEEKGGMILNVWHKTFDLKEQKRVFLKVADIKYYKQIARMVRGGKEWSIKNVNIHTSCSESKARKLHEDFKEAGYIVVSKGNVSTVTGMGLKFLERILKC